MKKTLLIITALMLVVGCSSPEPINYETTLIEKDSVFYTKDTNKPYSGKVFSLYEIGGQKESEGSFKYGKKEGLWTSWYKNGKKWKEGTYKDGVEHGKNTRWFENGQKESEVTYKDGEKDGIFTTWYSNGKKEQEGILQTMMWFDGRYSVKVGLWTKWYDNGQKKEEITWRAMEQISGECWDENGNEKECD